MRVLGIVAVVSACGFSNSVNTAQPGDDDPTPDAAMDLDPDVADPEPSTRRRVALTFRNGTRNEALDDFAALIVLDSTKVDYSLFANGGADLRFFDSDGTTPIVHEIELWDPAGKSYVWVRVPSIDAMSDTDRIYMHYGNPMAIDAQDPAAVWSTTHQSVWHLAQDPAAGGTDDIRDSTGIGNHGTPTAGMTTNDLVGAPIGFGLRLDGASNGIDADSMTLTTYTYSFWMRPDAAPVTGSGNHQPLSNGDTINFSYDHNTTGFTAAAAQFDGAAWKAARTNTQWAAATWYFVVVTYNGTSLCMHVNATQQNCLASSEPAPPNGPRFRFGLATSNSSTWRGQLDEVRVLDSALSATRISAEYANQRADAANPFVVFGMPEVLP